MKKVKITVLKTSFNEELVKEYGVSGLTFFHVKRRANIFCRLCQTGRVLR